VAPWQVYCGAPGYRFCIVLGVLTPLFYAGLGTVDSYHTRISFFLSYILLD
jgi:hypothetical protein